jgi:hypothetical protein
LRIGANLAHAPIVWIVSDLVPAGISAFALWAQRLIDRFGR